MSNAVLAKYLTPWKFKRAQERAQRIAELRRRDGDDCRRCRRPLRFDLTPGHDRGPRSSGSRRSFPASPSRTATSSCATAAATPMPTTPRK